MRARAWYVLALAMALLACGPASVTPSASTPTPAAEARAAVQPLNPPVRVRYGSQETVGGVGLYLAQEKGYFKEEGLEVEFERVTGGPDAVPALASGDLDFSQGALDPATFNAILRGIPIKFVTHLSLNRTDQVSSGLLIRQDLVDNGRFRELGDVKGMTIAIGPGTGSSAEMYLSRVLATVGLAIADVDPVTMSYPDAATALINKAVDASWHIQPFITNLESRGIAKMVAPLAGFYPGAVTNTLMISPGFAQREPEAARRFVTAQIRGQRDFWHAFIKRDTPAARDGIIEVLTRYTPVKDPQQWSDAIMPGVGLNGELSDALVEDYQTYFVKVGSQRELIPATQVVDHSYVEFALERLGRESY